MKSKLITSIAVALVSVSLSVHAIQGGLDNKDAIDESLKAQTTPIQLKFSRGQLLYENHCMGCHESQVHIREKHKAKNIAGIGYFVIIRAAELDLDWGNEDVEAVTQFLNQRYYKYTK